MGKRLAAHNSKKREKQKAQSEVNQYYGIGVVLAVGVIGGHGYYIYQTKKAQQPSHTQPNNPPKQPSPKTNKLKWIKCIPYYKMDQKSIVNDLYHASLISVFTVGN